MRKSSRKNGSIVSGGLDVNDLINSDLCKDIRHDLKCVDCLTERLKKFKYKMESIEKLPTVKKLVEYKQYRFEIDVRQSIDMQDFIATLDKAIVYNEDILANELKIKENKKKSNVAPNMVIPVGAPKLVLDADEMEIAAFMKQVLLFRNKKKNLMYDGTNKALADWICNSIIQENGHVLKGSTICNDLSKLGDYPE